MSEITPDMFNRLVAAIGGWKKEVSEAQRALAHQIFEAESQLRSLESRMADTVSSGGRDGAGDRIRSLGAELRQRDEALQRMEEAEHRNRMLERTLSENVRLKDAALRDALTDASRLQRVITALQTEMGDVRAESDGLRRSLEARDTALADARQENAAFKAETKRLTEEKSATEASLKITQEQICQLEETLDSLRGEFETLRDWARSAMAAREEFASELEAARAENESLREQLRARENSLEIPPVFEPEALEDSPDDASVRDEMAALRQAAWQARAQWLSAAADIEALTEKSGSEFSFAEDDPLTPEGLTKDGDIWRYVPAAADELEQERRVS